MLGLNYCAGSLLYLNLPANSPVYLSLTIQEPKEPFWILSAIGK